MRIPRQCLFMTSAAMAPAAAADPARADTAMAPARGNGQTMEIIRRGSHAPRKGPVDNFTGAVRLDPLLRAPRAGKFQLRQRHF